MSDLATLLGAHLSVEWYEAVALVREVADRLLEDPASSPLIPELNQIDLSPEGRVGVVGGIHTNEPVRRLGQLTHALLANSEAPVQLRLVISQATAPSPDYASIRQYSDALAFFERPDRSTVLQALAARAPSAATLAASGQTPTLDSMAPLPSTTSVAEPPKKKAPSPSSAGRRRFVTAVALIVLVCAGAGWYGWTRGVGPRSGAEAAVLADRAADAVGTAIVSGASAVTERLGLGRIVPANAVSPVAPVIPPAPPVSAAPEKLPTPKRATSPVPPLIAFDLDRRQARPAGRGAVAPETRPSDLSVPEPRPNDQTVYSVESPGVIPPIGVRPQLAQELPPDLDRDHLGRIELIVAQDGSVESAKLVTSPRTVNDGLFVSVVKAWSFQPALKDGFPVKYRKTIWIASPPP